MFKQSSVFSLLTEKSDKHTLFNINSTSHAFSCSANLMCPTALDYTLHTSIYNLSGSFTLTKINKMSCRFYLKIETKNL